MSAEDEVDELINQFHLAQGQFVKGNPEPVKKLLSQREDCRLAWILPRVFLPHTASVVAGLLLLYLGYNGVLGKMRW
jgi:hypothetical protein